MKKIYIILFLFLLATISSTVSAQCPDPPECIGSSLTLDGNNQYVDILTTPSLQTIAQQGELTFEAWIKPSQRPGFVQPIAGVWGPRADRDDQWLIEIDSSGVLRFMLSNGTTTLGASDNTVASYIIPSSKFDTWFHLACTWAGSDGRAKIYINGALVSDTVNSSTKCSTLRNVQSYLELASFNGFTNDPNLNRSFRGELDEVRLWSVRRPVDSIRCNVYHTVNPSSPRLVAYWRANGASDEQTLCDASPNANHGSIRNGAQQLPSTRTIPQTVSFAGFNPQTDTLKAAIFCRRDTSFTIRVTDSSICGHTFAATIGGADASSFTAAPSSFALAGGGATQLITITVNAQRAGTLRAALLVYSDNPCEDSLIAPLEIIRTTQLTLSPNAYTFRTIYHCAAGDTADTVVTVCNSSPGDQIISNVSVALPQFSVQLVGWSLPDTLHPSECRTIRMRFHPLNVAATYFDTVRIASTDQCPDGGKIPVSGRSQPALVTNKSALNFGDLVFCGIPPSSFLTFRVTSSGATVLRIDTIIVDPAKYTITGPRYPTQIGPGNAIDYSVRFFYGIDGTYDDTLTVRGTYAGCTVEKKILLHVRVFHNDFQFTPAVLSFGNVRVGQLVTQSVTLRNAGPVGRSVSVYLKFAKNYSLQPPTQFFIDSNQTKTLQVTFRPTDTITFSDTLCVQDSGCYIPICIPVTGKGYFDRISFSPPKDSFGLVGACACATDTMTVTNISATPITISNPRTSGAGYSLSGIVPPVQILAPAQKVSFAIRFCPGPGQTTLLSGEFIFDTDDPNNGTLRILLEGVRFNTLIISDPTSYNFGNVEVGTSQNFAFALQNATPVAARIDSITFPARYSLVGITVGGNPVTLPLTLAQAEIAVATVAFSPNAVQTFTGPMIVYSNIPCAATANVPLTGKGIIVKLLVAQTAIAFRKINRCQSDIRELLATNPSNASITVDSIMIIGPERTAFSWTCSSCTGFPQTLPPRTNDTILVRYDPNGSPTVTSNATLLITSRTSISTDTARVQLIGSREVQFFPSQDSIPFGAYAAFTSAPPQFITIKNPSSTKTLIIDSLTVTPDVGVFFVTATLPAVLAPNQDLSVRLDFTPRSAVQYKANLRVSVAAPCAERDSEIVITGSGFTQVVLVKACFDTVVHARSGDRITVPVNLSRPIPQAPVDVTVRLLYDRYAVNLDSVIGRSCTQPVSRVTIPGGEELTIRNCNAIAQGKLFDIFFTALVPDSVTSPIIIDSVAFSADTTRAYAFIGDGCASTVTIDGSCNLTRLNFTTLATRIEQNFPNPVSAATQWHTTIHFETMEDQSASIRIIDRMGRVVKELVNGMLMHGVYQLDIDASDLEAGVYFLSFDCVSFRGVRPITIVK